MGTTKIVGKLKNACLKNNQDREARMKRKFFLGLFCNDSGRSVIESMADRRYLIL